MGKTLEDILNDEFGLSEVDGGSEKTASEETPEIDEIEKLAAEIGLAPMKEQTKTASSKETKPAGQVKEASMGLSSLYDEMFPEEVAAPASAGVEKVAAQDKTAAEKEEAMGALAFDSFAAHFDRHITKMAQDLSAKVDEATDGKPIQTLKDNQPSDSHEGIDTDPEVTDIVKAQKGGEVVGTEDQKSPAGNGEKIKEAQMKVAALRKAMLAASLSE